MHEYFFQPQIHQHQATKKNIVVLSRKIHIHLAVIKDMVKHSYLHQYLMEYGHLSRSAEML